jgi:hypothetical protein
LQSNGSISIKSLSGGSYAGTVNPAGTIAKSNQSAVTQPPTVIITSSSLQIDGIIDGANTRNYRLGFDWPDSYLPEWKNMIAPGFVPIPYCTYPVLCPTNLIYNSSSYAAVTNGNQNRGHFLHNNNSEQLDNNDIFMVSPPPSFYTFKGRNIKGGRLVLMVILDNGSDPCVGPTGSNTGSQMIQVIPGGPNGSALGPAGSAFFLAFGSGPGPGSAGPNPGKIDSSTVPVPFVNVEDRFYAKGYCRDTPDGFLQKATGAPASAGRFVLDFKM